MKTLVAAALLGVFPACYLHAQQKRGVTLHGDPRLAIVVSKTRATANTANDDDEEEHVARPAIKKAIAKTKPAPADYPLPANKAIKAAPAAKSSSPTVQAVRVVSSGIGSSHSGRFQGNGFRVQIYYGSNRNEALQREADFIRHYPGIRTYFTFIHPNYRVKVGNFRTRDDANGMYKEANGMYGSCMIVPDKVNIK
ncbi:MAG: SPOR domain-containing protein [Chitinophagia bacterium]|nr:SPOR domain-containing protein [Chitinophagia bacterium]